MTHETLTLALEPGDPNQTIDHRALASRREETERELRALKQALRSTWLKPMHEEQRTMLALKHRATILCALRAISRGRLHIKNRPRGLNPTLEWIAAAHNLELAKAALERLELRVVPTPLRRAQ